MSLIYDIASRKIEIKIVERRIRKLLAVLNIAAILNKSR